MAEKSVEPASEVRETANPPRKDPLAAGQPTGLRRHEAGRGTAAQGEIRHPLDNFSERVGAYFG